jgi:hypothetical protein
MPHDVSTIRAIVPEAPAAPPGALVRATAWLAAAWCVGFAVVNVVLETGDRFEDGPYAAYAGGLAVMSWIVFALKLGGAAVALSSVRSRPPLPPGVLSALLWGSAALLGLYATGSVVEAVGMLTGVAGSRDQITATGVLYVLFFLLGALGYATLAVSFAHRFRTPRGTVLLGLVGAPAALGVLLLGIPRLLVVLGVMPDY